MNQSLNGTWSYRSFRHDPITVRDDRVVGEPELAAAWSPPGVLEVSTAPDGRVTGTLTFTPQLVLDISGAIVPATATSPAAVALTGKGHGSVNLIKGVFLADSDHVVGTVLCTEHDLARQPNGTAGPFVLVPQRR
jgi:hypothetical protein